MGWIGAEVVEEFVDEPEIALLGGFITDQQELEGACPVVRVGVESGFAQVSALAALVDRDDPPSFVVQAAGVDESGVSGVAQAWEVALFEVGESRGELVGVLLLVVLSGADEGRCRTDEPFKG